MVVSEVSDFIAFGSVPFAAPAPCSREEARRTLSGLTLAKAAARILMLGSRVLNHRLLDFLSGGSFHELVSGQKRGKG